MFKGRNDAAHQRSTHGRVTLGRLLVASKSWKSAPETRNALGAPGRPKL